MKLSYTINPNIDFNELHDSMQLESGQTLATLNIDKYTIEIRVCGDVRVHYKDELYKTPAQFPDELLELFKNGKAYDNPDVNIGMNNWFESFIYKDKEYIGGDVFDDSDLDPVSMFTGMYDIYLDLVHKQLKESADVAEYMRKEADVRGLDKIVLILDEDRIPIYCWPVSELDSCPYLSEKFKNAYMALAFRVKDAIPKDANDRRALLPDDEVIRIHGLIAKAGLDINEKLILDNDGFYSFAADKIKKYPKKKKS